MLTYAAAVSVREMEHRAAGRFILGALVIPLPLLVIALTSFPGQPAVAVGLLGAVSTALVALILPIDPAKRRFHDTTPAGGFDERDIVFSRRELRPGTKRYDNYYATHPGKKRLDDGTRNMPWVLSRESPNAHVLMFASADASFAVSENYLCNAFNGPVNSERSEVDPANITKYLKGWIRQMGADSVGVTELKEYHKYTHSGRREFYGEPVECNHRYAIAITIEMDHHLNRQGPLPGSALETAEQYLQLATITTRVAEVIRSLGYPAEAHNNARYQVVTPLVARDAGLGEIGRMSILITPKLGTRVRVAVVTTDLPLLIDDRNFDPSVLDFCSICEKCADVCPSNSIPFGPMQPDGAGVERWKLNADTCLRYWVTVGTDCGRCQSTCPYAHPNGAMHNVVRFFSRRSYLFRRLAKVMDDLLYGKKPPPFAPHDWQHVTTKSDPK